MLRARSTSTLFCLLFVAVALGSAAASAQETCPCPPPPPPPPLWTGSLGFSYLATTGNTDTESFGLSTEWSRQPTPWGFDLKAVANQAKTDGEKTAEHALAAARARRAMGERFELFGGLSWERDRFAGFDSRTIAEAGGIWRALLGPKHELAFDAGVTWTQQDPVLGAEYDFLGAVLGGDYAWHISETATFRERLVGYPNFDESDDWRLRSETTLEAALASSWAIRLGYLYMRDNQPEPGFEEVDTTTTISVVWKR